MVIILLALFLAYIIGSTPTAVLYGKWLYQIDVRDHGSGNPGATNTFRVLGKKAGTIVLLIDVAKGLLAASIATLLVYLNLLPEKNLVTFKLIFGVMAVLGHIFSAFMQFRGGKGVATLLGMMIAIHYEAALACVMVFLVVLLITKYVSLSSIMGALAFPLFLAFVPRFQTSEPLLIIFAVFLFIVVLWRHNQNIKRILEGKENKTYLIPRRKD